MNVATIAPALSIREEAEREVREERASEAKIGRQQTFHAQILSIAA